MLSKTLFLVLLGASFVLSSPVPEASQETGVGKYDDVADQVLALARSVATNNDVYDIYELDEAKLRSFREKWDKLNVTFHAKVQKWEKKWVEIKEKSVKTYYELVDKTTKILINIEKMVKEAKEAYKSLKATGTETLDQLKSLYKDATEIYKEIVKLAGEGYNDVKEILKEFKEAIREHELVIEAKKKLG